MTAYGLIIPEWTDREAYPKRYEDIYEGDWRWQFLRRDPEYQKVWSRGIEIEGSSTNRNPVPEDSEQCRTVFRVGSILVDPWGEGRITNAAAMMWNASTGALTINPPDSKAPRGPDTVMVGFDLNRPLKPQIDHAYRHLKFQQESLKEELVTFKKHKNKWPRHIRVIDAFDQGATPNEIYNQFVEEMAGDNDDKLDDFYRPGSQPDATAMGWHLSALKVMEMAIRLL